MEKRPFYSKKCFVTMVEELEVLESLALTVRANEELILGELTAGIFSGKIMCRNRYCGTCDGVGCERAYFAEIPAFSAILKRCVNAFYDEEYRRSQEE